MKICFPSKCVTRHTADKPWITDSFRLLIRKRQKAYMCGDLQQYRVLRNKVNRVAVKLKFDFYQQNIEAMTNSGSRVWWKHMKKLMGLDVNSNTGLQSLANKTTDGDCCILANKMNDFFLYVTEHLPRLEYDDQVFTLNDELPDQYVITVMTTLDALQHIKTGKATGPDNIPAWVLKDHAYTLASPLTAIFNSSLREGVLPQEWKLANVIPLPKANPSMSVEKDIRPISLTPIAAKVFESLVIKWFDGIVRDQIDDKQLGGISGTSTTDALVELIHRWSEATDKLNTYVRVVMLDFRKAFDLINHRILINKLKSNGIPPHLLRWLQPFYVTDINK